MRLFPFKTLISTATGLAFGTYGLATLGLQINASPQTSQPLHVAFYASPGGNGKTWALAFDKLESALTVATPGTEIWMTYGNYQPPLPGSGDSGLATFVVPSGVRIIGGFQGNETSVPIMPFGMTSFSSNQLSAAVRPSYHLFTLQNVTGVSIERVSISGGDASFLLLSAGGNMSIRRGGGAWCSNAGVTFVDVAFSYNNAELAGGALYAENGKIALKRCTFNYNSAHISAYTYPFSNFVGMGGAIYTQSAGITAANCIFRSNSALGSGGALSLHNARSSFTNCAWIENSTATGSGSAIQQSAVSSLWMNCTFANNASDPCFYSDTGSSATMSNCIVWSFPGFTNPLFGAGTHTYTVSYSDIQQSSAAYPGMGNINTDPVFVLIPASNLINDGEVDPCASPCIDKGNNAAIPPDVLDLNDNGNVLEETPYDCRGFNSPRRFDYPVTLLCTSGVDGPGTPPIVDMGCFEAP